MFQKADDPVAIAVDLVNTWDELEDSPEFLPDVAALRRFLERRGLAAGRLTRSDLERARGVRAALRTAFEAAADEAAVTTLNGVLRRSRAKPQLERHGGG